MEIVEFFLIFWGKIVRAGAGAGIFDKLEPEPELQLDKIGPAPQHCLAGCHSTPSGPVLKHQQCKKIFPDNLNILC
jgi:hypothetical protein